MSAVRYGTGALGVVLGGYGAWLLLTRSGTDQVTSVVTWLVAGVVLHDLVLAPVVVVVGVLAARVLPTALRAPVAVVAVVLGTVTVMALPVLLGREPANPTLLDRDYTGGWLLVASLVVVTVAVGTLVIGRRRRGPRARGR